MDHPYRAELAAAFSAVRRAARISREVIARARSRSAAKSPASSSAGGSVAGLAGGTADNGGGKVHSHAKADLSPVTVADFAVQALLTSVLHRAFPGDAFVGEESAAALRADPALAAGVWEALGFAVDREDQRQDGDAGDGGRSLLPATVDEMLELIDICGLGQGGRQGRIWVFDPIDGTQAYMHGGLHAINVGLLVDGVQQLGVIGCPNFDPETPLNIVERGGRPVDNTYVDPRGDDGGCIVYAVQGGGAWVVPMDERKMSAPAVEMRTTANGNVNVPAVAYPRRLPRHADAVTDPADLRFADWYTPTPDSAFADLHAMAAMEARGFSTTAPTGVMSGSQVERPLIPPYPDCDLLSSVMKYVVFGLGHANATVRVYKHRHYHAKVWDHAGAMLVFTEVGGKVTDIDGREMDLGAGRQLAANFGIVAAPAAVHGHLLKTLRDVLRREGKGYLLGQEGA